MARMTLTVKSSNKRALPRKPVVTARRLPKSATRKG